MFFLTLLSGLAIVASANLIFQNYSSKGGKQTVLPAQAKSVEYDGYYLDIGDQEFNDNTLWVNNLKLDLPSFIVVYDEDRVVAVSDLLAAGGEMGGRLQLQGESLSKGGQYYAYVIVDNGDGEYKTSSGSPYGDDKPAYDIDGQLVRSDFSLL